MARSRISVGNRNYASKNVRSIVVWKQNHGLTEGRIGVTGGGRDPRLMRSFP